MKKLSPKKVSKKSPARRAVTAKDFLGAQMSNFLHGLAQNQALTHEIRKTARDLQEKWDGIATFRLNNPIVAAELERKFFPKFTIFPKDTMAVYGELTIGDLKRAGV